MTKQFTLNLADLKRAAEAIDRNGSGTPRRFAEYLYACADEAEREGCNRVNFAATSQL
jgi:hypothetical protein